MKFPWYIWIPRTLIIIVAVFAAMFSLDVLEMNAGFWMTLMGLIMHNIPSLLLLLLLLFTWKRPMVGGVFFTVFAIVATALIAIYFRKYFFFDFVAFILPLLISAFFFFLAHFKRAPANTEAVTPTDSTEEKI